MIDSIGLGLTEIFLAKLSELGLSIEDCHGQGYNNGVNMCGCQKGFQARILEKKKTKNIIRSMWV